MNDPGTKVVSLSEYKRMLKRQSEAELGWKIAVTSSLMSAPWMSQKEKVTLASALHDYAKAVEADTKLDTADIP